jgi:tRNA (mo5U34)-methyltransferase
VSAQTTTSDVAALRADVAEHEWYHSIELAPGVVTPGWFDCRPVVGELPIPASLEGRRCLDIGTFDGFWAFELERRGAREVVALDVLDPARWDWPVASPPEALAALGERKRGGAGFLVAREALGSRVERLERSVYDLDPAEVGTFDFVYLGSLLLHLRDPVRALEAVRRICTGELLVVDVYDPLLTRLFPRWPLATLDARGRPWWWQASLPALVRMVEAAGFALTRPPGRIRMPRGEGMPVPRLRRSTVRTREARRTLWNARFGDPHAVLVARPA